MARRSEDDLFKQLVEVHASFRAKASMEQTEDGPRRIYRGYLGKLFKEHGLEGTGYVRVRDLLLRLGCIDIIQQGNANQTSTVIVDKEPGRESYDELRKGGGHSLRQVTGAKAGIQLGQLAARVQRLEAAFAAHMRDERKDAG